MLERTALVNPFLGNRGLYLRLGVSPHGARRFRAKPLWHKDLSFGSFSPHPLDIARARVYNAPMKDTPAIAVIGYFLCAVCLAAVLGIIIFGV